MRLNAAAAYLSAQEVAALEQCVQVGHTGNKEEIMEANKEFHEIIMRASNNA